MKMTYRHVLAERLRLLGQKILFLNSIVKIGLLKPNCPQIPMGALGTVAP
jgi:hypothetical protein